MSRIAYSVDEDKDGFVIRTTWKLPIWTRCLGAVAVGAFIGFLSHNLHASVGLSYALAIAAALLQGSRDFGALETCTTITKFEAKPSGKFPHRYKPASFVPLATIGYLVYREEESRGDDSPLPAGLWAEHESGRTCLVPELTEDEANALALRIEDRFGNVIGSGIASRRSTGGLTTLGLNSKG